MSETKKVKAKKAETEKSAVKNEVREEISRIGNAKIKDEITALDLHYLTKELQQLVDGKIDQVYQIGKEELFLQFHKAEFGKKILKIIVGKLLYLTEYKPAMPEKPPGFCTYLRKKLKNARLREIKQLEFERILELTLTTKEETFKLIIELFTPGNIILCDEKYKILSPLETQKWKDRIVRTKEQYDYPKKEHNFLEITKKEVTEILQKSDKENLVKTLAIDLGLGGKYSEELCTLSGIDKTKKANSASEKEAAELFEAVKKIRSRDVKLNTEYDSVFTERVVEQAKEETHKKAKTKLDKVKDIIKEQETMIAGLEQSANENQRKGELIYENYQAVEEVISELKKASKKISWEEIKEKLKKHKVIKRVDEKNKEVVLEL